MVKLPWVRPWIKEGISFRELLYLGRDVGHWDQALVSVSFLRIDTLRRQGQIVGADEKAFLLALIERTAALASDFCSLQSRASAVSSLPPPPGVPFSRGSLSSWAISRSFRQRRCLPRLHAGEWNCGSARAPR
mmetsp:Transcript_22299/g.52998  ORF Transcript_22299/g.52998 Transcript_22299/m.52998 type:complete len:133 (-) Transcript_22299:99-497(-)